MSVNFLRESTEMEIRPAPGDGKDVLFEMLTNDSSTICCKVDTSYDFVVRNTNTGEIYYCVSGIEIKDHPLAVYVSHENPLGVIVDMAVYPDGDYASRVQICRRGDQFVIDNDTTIQFSPGQVKISWRGDVSTTIKVMSVAFALNMALTNERETVIGGANTEGQQPYDLSCYANAPTTIVPRNNKQIKPSVFLQSAKKDTFWMMAAGWTIRPRKNVAFLMEEESREVRLYMESLHLSQTVEMLRVFDINGDEEFTATWPKDRSGIKLFTVTSQGQCIGTVEFNPMIRQYTIINQIDGSQYHSMTRANYNFLFMDLKNFHGSNAATLCGQYYPSLYFTIKENVSSSDRKLFTCTAFHCFAIYMKNLENLSITRFTKLTCNCNFCQQYRHPNRHEYFKDDTFFLNEKQLKVRAVGHNKKNNVTYFNVFRLTGGLTGCTLEVTPIENFEGVAKVVCKCFTGAVVFTAIPSPAQFSTAIYDYKDELMMASYWTTVYDSSGQTVMVVGHDERARRLDENLFGLNENFTLYDPTGHCVSRVSASSCCVILYRPGLALQPLTRFQLFFELTLAVVKHSECYRFDKLPTPEIVLCYYKRTSTEWREDFPEA